MKKKKLQKKLVKTKKRLAKALSELNDLKSHGAPVLAANVPVSLEHDTVEMAPELPVSEDELFETAAAANGHSVGSN